jgi:hypothetical protein
VGAKNELNLLIADHAQPTNLTVPTFITCQMWNASWTVNMTTTNNTQTIRTTRQDLLNLVEEPLRSWGNSAYHKENSTLNLNQALYTTFFLGIAKHLLGFVGAGRAPADAYPTRDEISALSDITQTVLADSAEYGTMMRNLSSLTSMLDQGASPKPLQVMIEEFSQNVTINLMSEDFFRYVQHYGSHQLVRHRNHVN